MAKYELDSYQKEIIRDTIHSILDECFCFIVYNSDTLEEAEKKLIDRSARRIEDAISNAEFCYYCDNVCMGNTTELTSCCHRLYEL